LSEASSEIVNVQVADAATAALASLPQSNKLAAIHRVYSGASSSIGSKYIYAPETERDDLLFNGAQMSHTGTKFAIVDFASFRRNFRAMTRGFFDEIDWSNLVVAGGSVLACLTHKNLEVNFVSLFNGILILVPLAVRGTAKLIQEV